jgi:hypothetical protein
MGPDVVGELVGFQAISQIFLNFNRIENSISAY